MRLQTLCDRDGPGLPYGLCLAFLLAATLLGLTPSPARAQAAVPQGVWLIDNKAAVQIFDCDGLMCGKVVWLYKPRNAEGELDRDKNNPDLALRQRGICGAVIIWGLRPAGPDQWRDGWFYNPEDGKTYRLQAQIKAPDIISARIYKGAPLFGRTKLMIRVPLGVTEGWC